jgi:hypothetical protein
MEKHHPDAAASIPLQESLQTNFMLPRNESITVCKWEACKIFREWYGKLNADDQMSPEEKSAAFQMTLLVVGSDPYFEATTLKDFITRTCGSAGKTILGLVTETLTSAIEREQNDRLFESAYARDDLYQLLLFEHYIILGCEGPISEREGWSKSVLQICQALRSPEMPISPQFNGSIAVPLEAKPCEARLSRLLDCILSTESPLKFQANTILLLQPLKVMASSLHWFQLKRVLVLSGGT